MRIPKIRGTILHINTTYEAETLTEKLRRLTEQKEPIKEEVEIVYTNKKDGVLPGYDIRTDRFEVARIAKEKIGQAEASEIAKSESMGVEKSIEKNDKNVGQEPS